MDIVITMQVVFFPQFHIISTWDIKPGERTKKKINKASDCVFGRHKGVNERAF